MVINLFSFYPSCIHRLWVQSGKQGVSEIEIIECCYLLIE